MKNITSLELFEVTWDFKDHLYYQVSKKIKVTAPCKPLPPLPLPPLPLPQRSLPPLPPVPGINHDVMKAEIQFIHDQNKELVHYDQPEQLECKPAEYEMTMYHEDEAEDDMQIIIWWMQKYDLSRLTIIGNSKKINTLERKLIN